MSTSTISPLIIQTEHLDDEPARWLSERAELTRCAAEDARFAAFLRDAAGLIVRTYTRVDAEMLEQAPKLRVVGRAGVGLDNIDVPACCERGVRVVYTPDANTQAVVEYVLQLMLAHVRGLPEPISEAVGDDLWKAMRHDCASDRQISDMTIGILGLGRIGARLVGILHALGARALYNDLLDVPESRRSGAQPVSIESLFAESDIVSVHIDGRASNRHFVGEELLNLMRDDAVLVNTSRGMVIDAVSLANALRAEPRRAAILDVHDPEPIDASNPLLSLPNAMLYPHIAARTQTAMRNMSWVVRDVWEVINGREPRHPAPQMRQY